jgi:hypothetical protein
MIALQTGFHVSRSQVVGSRAKLNDSDVCSGSNAPIRRGASRFRFTPTALLVAPADHRVKGRPRAYIRPAGAAKRRRRGLACFAFSSAPALIEFTLANAGADEVMAL